MTDIANLDSAILQAEINSAYLALKIVSLLPSATEIIDCLGLTDALVGCSHECDYPDSIKNLPVCTKARLNSNKTSSEIDNDVQTLMQKALSIYKIKTEVLEQLQPTHIITQDQCDVCAVNLPEVEKAIAFSIPTLLSSQFLLTTKYKQIARKDASSASESVAGGTPVIGTVEVPRSIRFSVFQ